MNFTKHIFLIAISFLGSISSFAQTKKVDVNIVALIKKMSIEEKAGQMTQIDLGVIAEGGICALKNPQTIDLKKIQEAISKYHIGSILNVGCGSGTISLENWHKILNTIHLENARSSKNNIPSHNQNFQPNCCGVFLMSVIRGFCFINLFDPL